jgi:copper oxidase (laccase) domain-containing protein
VSAGPLASLNLGEHRGDAPENVRENYRRAGSILGVGADDFAVSKQVHKTNVRVCSAADRHTVNTDVPYEADGLVTSVPLCR